MEEEKVAVGLTEGKAPEVIEAAADTLPDGETVTQGGTEAPAGETAGQADGQAGETAPAEENASAQPSEEPAPSAQDVQQPAEEPAPSGQDAQQTAEAGATAGSAAVAEAMMEAAQGEAAPERGAGAQTEEPAGEAAPEENKKSRRGLIIGAAVAVAALGIGYAAYAQQFEDRFIKRTTINGIDVGGLTVEEAEDVLRTSVENYSLTIDFLGGHTHTIKSGDFDFTYLPGDRIASLMESQNKYFWGKGFVARTPYEIETPAAFSVDKLEDIVEGFEEVSGDGIISPRNACMYYTKSGRFSIIPEIVGNEIDPAALTEAVLSCASHNETTLDAVGTDGIYLKPSVYADDAAMNERLEHLNQIFKVSISYNMPEDEGIMTFDSEDLIKLTGPDESGYMYRDIDEETLKASIRSFVAEMAETDIMTDHLPFKSTDLGTVYFDMGTTWGHVINQDLVNREMQSCFENGRGGTFDLAYTYQKDCPNRIGDTYIEVDIPTQYVYYYIDGELVYYCGCVSGREYDRRTPTGIYSIINKSRSIYLEGDFDAEGNPGYRSFVNFWMKFYKGYGLHDASWRSNSQFGTQTYKYSGSHGCVNLSYRSAQFLYENAPVGTPVLIVRN